MLILGLFSLICIIYCSEDMLKINITAYGIYYYYLTCRDKLYHWYIMGWSSGFPKITEAWCADASEITCKWKSK